MGRIRKSIRIEAEPEDVFAYMDDVNRRGQHMLGMGCDFHPEILSENATGVGATYRWSGTMYGVKFGWTEVVTRWVENREKFHHSIEGMKIDMGWSLTPQAGGTLLTMSMDYDIGYSLLGRLIDWIWAERYCSKGIEADFQHMKQALEKPRETSMNDGEKAIPPTTSWLERYPNQQLARWGTRWTRMKRALGG